MGKAKMKHPRSIKRRKQFRRRPPQIVMSAGAPGTGAAGSIAETPSTMDVEAKGTVAGEAPPPPRPQPGPETWGWQGADQTGEQIARQINQSTPLPLRLETGQQASVAIEVVKAIIPIVPTLYPEEPGGALIIHNYVTININSTEFAEFSAKIDKLLDHVGRSNEMSPEVRAKTAGEITAGMAIATSPKPDRDWLRLLLFNPLKWLAEKAGSVIINKLAADALALLIKLTGLPL